MTVSPVEEYWPESESEPEPERHQGGRNVGTPKSPPQPAVNEEEMLGLADRMEDETVEFGQLSDRVATADADYHYAFYTAMVNMTGVKPAEVRKARAHLEAESQYREWRLLQEQQRSQRALLSAIEKKIDVRRTVAANYRGQG